MSCNKKAKSCEQIIKIVNNGKNNWEQNVIANDVAYVKPPQPPNLKKWPLLKGCCCVEVF